MLANEYAAHRLVCFSASAAPGVQLSMVIREGRINLE